MRTCLTLILALLCHPATAAERPNIILFIADDMAWDDCGAYGHPHIRTPNIDKLAAQGMRFDSAFLTCSSCSPSRSSIITGRYPHNTGAEQLHWPLPGDQVIFPELLKRAGYHTAAVGKWHLGKAAERGFDQLVSQVNAMPQVVKDRPKDKPFFGWFAFIDPHRPYQKGTIPEPHRPADVVVPPYLPDVPAAREDLAMYYDEITRLDGVVGQVMAELDAQGAAEDTLILFISDNGRPFPRDKTTVYDSGVKTPFVIRYPKMIGAGTTCDRLVSSIDIAPSFLELAGLEAGPTFQGESFVPLLKNPKGEPTRDQIAAEHNWHDYTAHRRAVRTAKYKYIRNGYPELPMTPPADAVNSPTYRAMRELRDAGRLKPEQAVCFVTPQPAEELYDLEADPFEMRNLAGDPKHAAALEEMRGRLDRWIDETNDGLPRVVTPDEFDRETGQRLPGFTGGGRTPRPGQSSLRVSAPADRPNVLVIITDDQRFDGMSALGHPFMKTPNMDRLAREGAVFRNSFVTTSLCSPSRASMLSGLYAHTHKVLNNFTDYPTDLASYPKRLHDAGYSTAYVGKWHMGEDDDEQRPGFDHWISHKGQGNYFDNTFNVNGRRELHEGYYTTNVTRFALDWINRDHDKPWLMILGHKAPHGGPIEPDTKYLDAFDDVEPEKPATYKPDESKPEWLNIQLPTWHGIEGPKYGLNDFAKFIRYYHATLLSVDDSTGLIYEALEKSGQLDDTMVIFLSDNGFALGEHGRVDKRTMYEESIRVPLVVRYPKLAKPGTVVDGMVLNIDLAPSIVDVCGAEPMEGIHGRSWKPLLSGEPTDWRKSWVYEYNYEKEFPFTPNVRGVRTDRWKYIHYPHGDGSPDRHMAELYDLEADPIEKHNLIDDPKHREKLEELKKELARLQEELRDPGKMPVDQGIKRIIPEF